jgi:hypothetical protein
VTLLLARCVEPTGDELSHSERTQALFDAIKLGDLPFRSDTRLRSLCSFASFVGVSFALVVEVESSGAGHELFEYSYVERLIARRTTANKAEAATADRRTPRVSRRTAFFDVLRSVLGLDPVSVFVG